MDFYLKSPQKIVIEIDGENYSKVKNSRKDRLRNSYLRGRGFKILRFRNDIIMKDINRVKETIAKELK